MSDVAVAVLLGLGLVAGAWLLRDPRTLPPTPAGRPDAPSVGVVVPARDEELSLPALLASVRPLASGVGTTVVVDDASRDATADAARAGGAVVIPAGEPLEGWTGKAWACHVGAAAAGGDLLLFLDADTVLAPDALDRLLCVHDGHPGLVSVQPFHAVERADEQLSAYFNAVAVLASGAFRRRPTGRPLAFGPCLLTTRADYERVGGHAAVRDAVLDDAGLAAAYDRAGLPVRCLLGGEAVRMRSYPGGLRAWAAGWTKNIASGASAAAPLPTLGAVLWLCAHHAVAVGTVLAVLRGEPSWWWALGWLAAAGQLWWVLRHVGSFRWWTSALFPVPLLAFDVLFARSVVHTVVRRSVRWRGREVRL